MCPLDKTVTVRLLGPPRYLGGRGVHDLPLDRSTYLLTLLCCRGSLTREEAVAFFWPDEPLKVARHNLSQLLYRCRQLPWGGSFESRAQQLLWWGESDVARFREACRARSFEEALEHYEGGLLGGAHPPDLPDFDAWLELERRDLQSAWGEAVQRRAAQLEQGGRYAEAAGWLKALLKVEPLADGALQSFLRLAALSGQRDEALSFYSSLRRSLEHTYDLTPPEETERLAQALRRGGLTGAAPPPQGIAAPPALPEPTEVLVGRGGELADLSAWAASPTRRLLTLLGPGGVGKTRLALEVGRAQAGPSAAGATFVPLVGVTSGEGLLSQLAAALQLPPGASGEVWAQVLTQLRREPRLLILDNAEDLTEAADTLYDLLEQTPLTKVLVTTRVRLNLPAEEVYELAGLDVPAPEAPDAHAYGALQLLVQKARQADARFCLTDDQLPAAVRICRAVGGLPLGIALAVSWVRAMPLAEIAQSLQDNLGLLREEAVRTGSAPRHHSMAAVLETSWAHLSAAEQLGLTHLAVFQGPFDRQAALEVAKVPLSALLALAQKSLLQVSRAPFGRFSLHPLVQRFVQRKAGGAQNDLVARHSGYYTAFVVARADALLGAQQAEAFAAIGAELGNVRAAWEALVRARDLTRVAALIDPLVRFYGLRGELHEARSFLQQVCAVAADHPLLLARARTHLGWFSDLLGEHASAQDALRESEAVFREGRKPLERALCLFYIGETAYRQHRLEAAERAYREGLEITDPLVPTLRQTLLRAELYAALGRAAYQRDDLGSAQAHGEAALALLRDNGARGALALCLSDLGLVALAFGRPRRAARYLEESLALLRDLRSPLGTARALNNLANLFYEERAYDQAAAHLSEALRLFEALGDLYGAALADYNLGRVFYQQAAYGRALEHHQRSLSAWRALGNELRVGALYNHLGRVHLALGQLSEAGRYFFESLRHALVHREQARAANALAGLGLLFGQQGEEERARLCLACALHLFNALEGPPQAPRDFFKELLALYPADLLMRARDDGAPPSLERVTDELLQGYAAGTGGAQAAPFV